MTGSNLTCQIVNNLSLSMDIVLIGVPQSSVLGHLLFLIYINNLNKAIQYCKLHHFTDDTNFFIQVRL